MSDDPEVTNNNDIHVIPVGDTREHVAQKDCWCEPFVEIHQNGDLVTHRSADCRELYEKGIRKPH